MFSLTPSSNWPCQEVLPDVKPKSLKIRSSFLGWSPGRWERSWQILCPQPQPDMLAIPPPARGSEEERDSLGLAPLWGELPPSKRDFSWQKQQPLQLPGRVGCLQAQHMWDLLKQGQERRKNKVCSPRSVVSTCRGLQERFPQEAGWWWEREMLRCRVPAYRWAN